MRFQLETEIDLPRERVVELFLDPQNLKRWQPELVSFEQISGGDPREVGAKNRQIHRMGRRDTELIETVTVHNSPDEFSATYEADGIWNLVENRFFDVGPRKTKWVLDFEFECTGIVIKLMTMFLPGMFKRQTFKFMERFKAFAESQAS